MRKSPQLSPLWVKFMVIGRPFGPASATDQTPSRCLVFSFKVYFFEEGLYFPHGLCMGCKMVDMKMSVLKAIS